MMLLCPWRCYLGFWHLVGPWSPVVLSSLILRVLPSCFHLLEHHNYFPKCPPPSRAHLILTCSTSAGDLLLRQCSASWSGCGVHLSLLPEASAVLQMWPDRGSSNGSPYFPESALSTSRGGVPAVAFATAPCPWLSLSLRSANTET